MIKELAARLKTKREKLGIDLEEAVEKTKLHPLMIKALEAGRWEEISPAYLKGFLKIYCSFLGESFDESEFSPLKVAKKEDVSLEESQKAVVKKYFDIKNLFFLLESKLFFVLLVGSLFLFGTFFLVKKVKNKPPIEEVALTGSGLEKKGPLSPKKVSLVDKDSLYVSLIARKDCFVTVKVEGKIVFEGVLKRGVVENWKANKEIEFNLSDGSAVEIEVNGKFLPHLTKARRPIKSLKITPAGISVEK